MSYSPAECVVPRGGAVWLVGGEGSLECRRAEGRASAALRNGLDLDRTYDTPPPHQTHASLRPLPESDHTLRRRPARHRAR